jgi:hypothetical protein
LIRKGSLGALLTLLLKLSHKLLKELELGLIRFGVARLIKVLLFLVRKGHHMCRQSGEFRHLDTKASAGGSGRNPMQKDECMFMFDCSHMDINNTGAVGCRGKSC